MMRDHDATPALTDAAIRAMFDRRARQADAVELRGPILTATLSERQRQHWLAPLPIAIPLQLVRALIVAAVVAAVVGLGVIGSGALHADPTPGIAPGFVRPFDYSIPAGADFRPSGEPRRAIIAWAAGAALPHEPGVAPDSRRHPSPAEDRGIVIGWGGDAWSHGDSARFKLGTRPPDFLTDLRDTGNVPMSTIAETTLDGRPASAAMLPGTSDNDIHVSNQGLSGDFVLLSIPSRLIVADIDGETIFILIWARTADDLAAWLPDAEGFVSSIHFERRGQP